jgi:hypothetical protein
VDTCTRTSQDLNCVTQLDNSVTQLSKSDKSKRGPKFKYGEPTLLVRVPKSKFDYVTQLLASDKCVTQCDNCVTQLKINYVTQLIFSWKQKISGREKLTRWYNTYKLLEELEKLL